MRDAPTSSIPRGLRLLGVAAVLAGVLGGCGARGRGRDAAPTSTTALTSTTTTEVATTSTAPADGDCPSVDAMAEVLGGSVRRFSRGGGVGRSDGLSYSETGCDYRRTAGDGGASVGRITLTDPPAGAPFELLRSEAEATFAEEGFEALDDLGDDAYRDGTQVAVLHGSTLFFVTAAGATDGEDTAALANAEAVAADALDLDLTVDPAALCPGFAARVGTLLGPVEDTVALQGSVGVDEVSIDTAGCRSTLTDGSTVSIERGDGARWDDWVAAKQASTFRASYAEAAVGERSAFDDGEALVVDDGAQPLRIATEDLEGDLDGADVRLEIAELVLG